MAARALQDLKNAIIKTYTIKSGVIIAPGNRIRFGASDTECDLTSGALDDTTIGTALSGGVGNAAGTVLCQVVLDFYAVVPMLVGTGGSTRGVKQQQAANGITDTIANGGGTVSKPLVGVALQTGVVGDMIGVGVTNGRCVTA